jgi:hypothetical protein
MTHNRRDFFRSTGEATALDHGIGYRNIAPIAATCQMAPLRARAIGPVGHMSAAEFAVTAAELA